MRQKYIGPTTSTIFVHHVNKIIITSLHGEDKARSIFVYDANGYKTLDITSFGMNVEWIIPDDVFEAEFKRRGKEVCERIRDGREIPE